LQAKVRSPHVSGVQCGQGVGPSVYQLLGHLRQPSMPREPQSCARWMSGSDPNAASASLPSFVATQPVQSHQAPVRLYRPQTLGLFSLSCNSSAQAITWNFQHIAETLDLFAMLYNISSVHSHTRILLYCTKQHTRQKRSLFTTMQSSINFCACHAV